MPDLSAFLHTLPTDSLGATALETDGDTRLFGMREGSVLVGLRLTQDEGGSWSITETAVRPAATPTLTPEDLRNLAYGAVLAEARGMIAVLTTPRAARRLRVASPSEVDLAAFTSSRRGSRVSNRDYALLALAYVMLVQEGSRTPARALAAQHGGSAATWSNRIAEARRRGLLTEARQGESGGRLTLTAERLLGHDS